jgi:hypothetical protein
MQEAAGNVSYCSNCILNKQKVTEGLTRRGDQRELLHP